MIKLSLLCQTQRKTILSLATMIVVSIFGIVFIYITIVTKNLYIANQVVEKKNNLSMKKNDLSKINKAITRIKKRKVNTNFSRKSGFYTTFDKKDFISNVIAKMNGDNDVDFLEKQQKTGENSEYSDFFIKLILFADYKMNNMVQNELSKISVSNVQDVDIHLDINVLHVTFKADYEFVAYKVLAMLKSILPGYVIVKSFSVKSLLEENKHFLYNRKFKPSAPVQTMDNRLGCEMELIWVLLSSANTEKFANNGV